MTCYQSVSVCVPSRNNIYTRDDLKRFDPLADTDTAQWLPDGHVTYVRVEPADRVGVKLGWFTLIGSIAFGAGSLVLAPTNEIATVNCMAAAGFSFLGVLFLVGARGQRTNRREESGMHSHNSRYDDLNTNDPNETVYTGMGSCNGYGRQESYEAPHVQSIPAPGYGDERALPPGVPREMPVEVNDGHGWFTVNIDEFTGRG